MTDSTSEPRDEGPEAGADNLDPDLAPTIASDGSRSSGSVASASVPGVEHPGSCIGPYALVELLGEGGFGTVWRARQDKPVKREVALKVIKPGRDTAEVIARFEQERQTLARLSHPNIARIFDAGTTEKCRPFFVMELAPGEPVATYCDRERLDIPSRLHIFLDICAAVRHAHQKGVIHRDLKPSNILVEESADGPRVKVIDFGIAKALDVEEDGHEGFTLQGTLIGTPQYMSPEQTGMDGVYVDTRADIYSLGVILYELLTGVTPLDPKALRKAGWEEVLKDIRESDPARPSTRLLHLESSESEAITRVGDTSIRRLSGILRGDLDWITLKALEKEPDRRYETVNALAQELRRFLANEPVLASPPSVSYRVGKFVKRNRALVGALATVFVVAAAAAIVSTREAIRANRAEGEAIVQRDDADEAKALAEERADTIERNLYFAEMNLAGQSAEQRSGSVTVAELTQRWLPEMGKPDLRDWEWYYLDSLTRSEAAVFRGHTGFVREVVWSPDGQLVASVSHDLTIRIWDAKSGTCVRVMHGHSRPPETLDWSPDGRRLVSGGFDSEIRVWNSERGKVEAVLKGHQKLVKTVRWSPDGKWIASSELEGPVIVWNWGDKSIHRRIPSAKAGDSVEGFDLSWSPDSKFIAMAKKAPNVKGDVFRIVDAITGEEVGRHEMYSRGIRWAPTGTTVALLAGRDIRIFDLGAERITGTLKGHRGLPMDLAWRPDGRHLASASRGHFVNVWSIDQVGPVTTFKGHHDAVDSVSWSPDGRFLASGSHDQTVRIWDVEARLRKESSRVNKMGSHLDVSWSPDGKRFVMAGGVEGIQTVTIVEAKSLDVVPIFAKESGYIDVCAWSPNGEWIAAGIREGWVGVWSAESGDLFRTIEGFPYPIRSLAWDPGGSRITAGSRDRLVAFDVESDEILFEEDTDAYALSWNPSGECLASYELPDLVFREGEHFGELCRVRSPHGELRAQAWNHDGSLLASVGAAKPGGVPEIVVWSGEDKGIVNRLKGCHSRIRAIGWNPEGTRIVTGEDNGMLRIWDLDSGSQTLSLEAHGENVNGVAWSPDGRKIVSCGYGERGVRIWDATKGYEAEERRRKEAESP